MSPFKGNWVVMIPFAPVSMPPNRPASLRLRKSVSSSMSRCQFMEFTSTFQVMKQVMNPVIAKPIAIEGMLQTGDSHRNMMKEAAA